MFTPGATIPWSAIGPPWLENDAIVSVLSTAPTAIVLLTHAGATTPEVPEFPDAATTVTPAATALLMELVRLGKTESQFGSVIEIGPVPRLMLITLAPLAVE